MKNDPQVNSLKDKVFESAENIILSYVPKYNPGDTTQLKMNSFQIKVLAGQVVSQICDDKDGLHLELNQKQRDVLRNQVVAAIKAANSEIIKGKHQNIENFSQLKEVTQTLNKACEYVIGVQTQDKAELERIEKKVHRSSGSEDLVVSANNKDAADKMKLLIADALKREPRALSTFRIDGIGEITRKDAQSLLMEQFLFSGIRMFFTHPIRTLMQAFGLAPSRDSITRDLSEQLGLIFVREGGKASVKLMDPHFEVAYSIFDDKTQEKGAPDRFTKNFMLFSELLTNQESYTQIRNMMEASEALRGMLPPYSKFVGNLEQMLMFKAVISHEDGRNALFKYFQDKSFASLQMNSASYDILRGLVPDHDLPEITAFKDFTELQNALGKLNHPYVTKFMSEQLFNKRDFDELQYALDNFNSIFSAMPENSQDTSKMWQANLARQIQTVADGMQHNRIVNEQTPDQQLKSLEEYTDNLLELLSRPDAVRHYGQTNVKKMVDEINSVRDGIIDSIYNKAEYNIENIIANMKKVGLETVRNMEPEVVKKESHVDRVTSQVSVSTPQQVI